MTILQIYSKYQVMPNLQLHMLRVAAVAWQICENMNLRVDLDNTVKACLLHDMGNIIKFKLDFMLELLVPEGKEYWQKVKANFIAKYGNQEDLATYQITKELDLNPKAYEILKAIGFGKSEDNFNSSDYNFKIATYSDQRVSIHGIVSLTTRLEEGKARYAANKNVVTKKSEESFIKHKDFLLKIEHQIFSRCKIKPEDITDASSKKYIYQLKNYEI